MTIKKGDIVRAEVTGIEDYGIFVKVENKYNGLIHISEIASGYVSNVNEYVKLEEQIYVLVLDIDNKSNQLKLSIKNINYQAKNIKNKANETRRGFLPLYEKLDSWTNEAIDELNKNT